MMFHRMSLRGAVLACGVGIASMATLVCAPWQACLAQPGIPEYAKSESHGDKDEKSISEETLRQELVGKRMYLRGGYLGNSLHFSNKGLLIGSAPPKVSYTLSLIEIEKVHLNERRLEIQGIRYGVHFLDEGSSEDALANADKVRITPKKKVLTITVDRARVEKQKKVKEAKHKEGGPHPASEALSSDFGSATGPASPASSRRVFSHANANQELRSAIQTIFSDGLDEQMIRSLPDYWQTYFRTIATGTEYKPAGTTVLRQSATDRKARLISNIQSPSNDFAQMAGVVGIAQYHVVVGPDGRALEVAVGRPIGFGLDENAVESIRRATFEPAMKDGRPVPVLLDVLVQFRIYSQRTAAAHESAAIDEAEKPATHPGPYSTPQQTEVPK